MDVQQQVQQKQRINAKGINSCPAITSHIFCAVSSHEDWVLKSEYVFEGFTAIFIFILFDFEFGAKPILLFLISWTV